MAVQDLWYTKKKDGDGNYIKSASYKKCRRYRVTWPEGGKYITESFDDLKAAKNKDASVRVKKADGTFVSTKAGEVSFRVFAEQWMERHECRARAREKIESNLRNHIVDFFGDRRLKDIEQSDVVDWKIKLGGTLAPTTAKSVFGYGVAIFKAAVAVKKIPDSPFDGVEAPKPLQEDVEPLPVELVQSLIDVVPKRHRALIVVGAAAGLRLGEALTLEANHISRLHRKGPVLRVRQQLGVNSGRPLFLAPPKTAKSRRDVPMSDILQLELAAHLEEFPGIPWTLDDESSDRAIRRPARLLFAGSDGEPIRHQRIAAMIRGCRSAAFAMYRQTATDVLDRAHVEAQIAQHAEFTFHDLRHFYASLLIANGATVHEVQAALGHSTPTLTLNTYGHLWPGADDRTRSAVDAVLGAPRRHLHAVA